VAHCLRGNVPIVAATDYVAAYAGLIAGFIHAPFTSLGTDGFGRSDTRVALRRFFEVDRYHIVLAALRGLADQGTVDASAASEAIRRYELDSEAMPPWTR
jgi:pyruvate dehydrogenase E1 component